MTLNIITLPPFVNNREIGELLDEVKEQKIDSIAIVGFDGDGYTFFRTNGIPKRDLLWLAEMLREKALSRE